MNEAHPPRSAVVDLRQYTVRPDRRDDLIELFDTYFVDGQEQSGMHVIGQFRDLDDPDRFVWLRGFASMPARAAALADFYYGPVWQAHREQANDTLLDSDDALLLDPLWLGADYPGFGEPRVLTGTAYSVVGITIVYRNRPVDARLRRFVLEQVAPELAAAGATPVAVFVTDPSPNNFPALPLREENVVAWVTKFDDDDAYADHRARLLRCAAWRETVLPELTRAAARPMQELRLRPTSRSHLR